LEAGLVGKISSGICSAGVEEIRGFLIETKHSVETFGRVLLQRGQEQ
jgi:hypothetical protein